LDTEQSTEQVHYLYDIKDHLGNVRLVHDDSEQAKIYQGNYYSAFGVSILSLGDNMTPTQTVLSNDRLYNGKELQDGTNWLDYGARMYYPELGRWMAVDPLADTGGQESWSTYQYVFNNPAKLTDPDGRCPLCGFVVGAGVDYAFQVAGNMANGKSFTEALTYKIDRNSILISGVAGAVTSGLSAIGGKGTQFAITTAIDATESVAKQINTGGIESVSLSQTASDVGSNKLAGFLTKKAENIVDTKVLKREADRTARISANDPSSTGRAAKAEAAKSSLNRAEKVNKIVGQTVSGGVGNTIQNISNAIRTPSGSSYSPTIGIAKSDATNVQRSIDLIRPNK